MSFPSIPQIPTIPVGVGGTIQVPTINIPNVPQLPTIPPITNMSGLSGLKALTGAIPGLAGGGSLCGISVKQIDVFATVELIKTALAGRVAAATILGVSGSSLLSKLDDFRKLSIQYVSFQAQLQNLNTKDPVAVAAFLNMWKDKVPGGAGQYVSAISDALNKGLEYDYCKLVPNINIDPNTGIAKVLAKNSPTPSAAPTPAEPITPTIVDNSKKPDIGNSGVVIYDLESEMQIKVWDAWKNGTYNPLVEFIASFKKANIDSIKTSDDWISITGKVSKYGKIESALQSDGLLTPSESATLNRYVEQKTAYDLKVNYAAILSQYFEDLVGVSAVGDDTDIAAITDYGNKLKEDKTIDSLGYRSYFTAAESLVNSNAGLLKKWGNYSTNKKA